MRRKSKAKNKMQPINPTERFTHTVDNYTKYRPSYPQEVITLLQEQCGLTKNSIVADVGSGTGIFTQLLLEQGCDVYAIEPNQAMREGAEQPLSRYKNFHSLNGTAENTLLTENFADIITVATAFHWFKIKETKKEFQRILKPQGWVVLLWNVRDQKSSPLLRDYEQLLIKYAIDYSKHFAEKSGDEERDAFFGDNKINSAMFSYAQYFDFTGLQGRLLSTSYAPTPEHPHYQPMLSELKIIFDKYQKNGQVEFLYQTQVYYGHLK